MENEPANRGPETPLDDETRRKELWLALSQQHRKSVSGDIPRGHGQKITGPVFFLAPRPNHSPKKRRGKKSKKRKWGSGGGSLVGSYSKSSSRQKFGR
jgi:hypothetical protein